MARGIATFPPEVRAAICSFLPRSDLKTARLLSHAWDAAAQRFLFHTIYLRVNLRSFERLQDIAHHETLRKHVRTISYEGSELPSRDGQQTFQEWLRLEAGEGIDLDKDAKSQFLSQFSTQQLEQYYLNYCRYWYGQEHINRRSNERDMLVEALGSLTGLSSIQYYVEPRFPREGLSHLDSLSPIFKEILAKPRGRAGYHASGEHFGTLLQAACLSRNNQLIEVRTFNEIFLGSFNTAVSVADCIETLPALQHLFLQFCFDERSEGDTTLLTQMIAHLKSIRSFELSFDFLTYDHPELNTRLLKIIPSSTYWKDLRYLFLCAIFTTEGHLCTLLQKYATTLRVLKLWDIELEKAVPADHFGNGSWIRIIHFLSESMSLDEMTFGGELSNGVDETWATGKFMIRSFRTPPHLRNGEYILKGRIERYITNGGPSPFTPMSTGVNDDGLPWIYEPDSSWYFDAELHEGRQVLHEAYG